MKKDKIVILLILAVCLVAFVHWRGSHSQYVDFGFRVGNLVLFVTLIWYAAGAKVKAFFTGRSVGIAKELGDIQAAREQAAKNLKEIESRVINLDKERQAILADYKAQGDALKSEIIIRAEKTARQIVAQAKKTAQNEVDMALESMRAEISEEIGIAVETLLKQRLTSSEHEKLVAKSLNKVVLN